MVIFDLSLPTACENYDAHDFGNAIGRDRSDVDGMSSVDGLVNL